MNLESTKKKFLQTWGTLGSSWGINKTMAQVHALLLVSEEALSTEDIMHELNVSRGNANMNIRALLDWGLVKKEYKSGQRMEFFAAEKDMWKISRLIARERHKRELEPALRVLEELQQLKESGPEAKAFKKRIGEIYEFSNMVNRMLEKFIQSNNTWFMKLFSSIIK